MPVTGHFWYQGAAVSQHDGIVSPFEKLFEAKRPARILEIGTCWGGLTLVLHDLARALGISNCNIMTFDIPGDWYDQKILHRRIAGGALIDAHVVNIFEPDYSKLNAEWYELIKRFITADGVTLVICDGGSKKDEVRIFAELMKPGDVVMAHDYAPSSEVFENEMRGKIWNWCEITDMDVAEPVAQFNLKPLYAKEFMEVAWLCLEKQNMKKLDSTT